MALSSSGIASGQGILYTHVLQYFNLLTGIMTDQPVTLSDGLILPATGTTGGLIDLGQTTTPAAPGTGLSRYYAKADGLYVRPNGGSESFIGPTSGATTFLLADVPITPTGTWVSGPNTGSVGGAGQLWAFLGIATMLANVGVERLSARLWDGTTGYMEDGAVTVAANDEVCVTVFVILPLSGAITITLQARDTNNTGVLKTSISGATTPNISTNVSAWRLK